MLEFTDEELNVLSEAMLQMHKHTQLQHALNNKLLRYLTKHKWVCISPGGYDSLYECKWCGLKNIQQADNPRETENPVYGCHGEHNVG